MMIPLGFLDEATLQDISALPIHDLRQLLSRLKEAIETQDKRRKILTEALKLRFGVTARTLLNQDGKDTGTIRFQEDGCTVTSTFRKKVDWDQDGLARVLKESPQLRDHIRVTLSVEEKVFSQLSEEFQKLLEPARSVKVGGYDFTIHGEQNDI